MDPKVDSSSNSVSVLLDESVFPRPVGLAAAYHFLDRCYVRLERRPQRRLQVRLKGKEPLDGSALRGLGEEFGNELVHQLMRHQVSERTEQLRAILVGRAMLSAEPEEAPEAAAPAEAPGMLDYLDDPLGIAVPWEEKHGEPRQPPAKKRKKSRR
jgi:His-Xaa-Ser system protein HxsD